MGPPSVHSRHAAISDLRARLSALEARAPGPDAQETARAGACPLGAEAIDAHLPGGGLGPRGVHEITPASPADAAAACGFALAFLSRFARAGPLAGAPMAWIANRAAGLDAGTPYGPGLASFGLDPGDLILIETRRDEDALRALEDCTRAGALCAVVAEIKEADFTATRRLALAAEATGTPAILLAAPGRTGASAARTRWRIAAAPSARHADDIAAPGAPRWRTSLERCRDGRPQDWVTEWDDETRSLRVAAELAARPAPAGRTAPARPWRAAG